MHASPLLARRTFLRVSALALGCAAWFPSWARGEAAPQAETAPINGVGTLTWLGQSCFLLETTRGTRILMDPLAKGLGFELPAGLKADLVTISHDHPDHANLGLLASRPRVLRGLTGDKKGWVKIEEKFRDVSIRSVGVYHDEKRGTERGLNTIFLFEVGGMRIAHLGDLGHMLTDEQRSDIGAVDVVLLPVGGTSTIDAEQATQVMQQLRPRLMVVPMHYRPTASGSPEGVSADEGATKAGPHAETNPGNKAGASQVGTSRGSPAKASGKSHRGKAPPTPPPVPPPPASSFGQIATIDEFLGDKTNVRRIEGFTLTLSPVKPRPGTEIVVFGAGKSASK